MAGNRIEFGATEPETGDLFVAARTLVEGLLQGRHRSPQRGLATEFYDFRAYNPGEPAARIDWRVYARTDRHYVRRRQHEAQLSVTLVLDASASMAFAALDPRVRAGRVERGLMTKLGRARELAAAVAMLTVRQGDRVGLVAVGREEPRVVRTGAGWGHLHEVIRALEEVEPSGDAGLSHGLEIAARTGREKGLIVGVGDALEEPEALLGAMARLRFGAGAGRTFASAGPRLGRDIALLQVLSADELDLGGLEAGRLFDPESGVVVEARGEDAAADYAAGLRCHLDALQGGMTGMGGRYALSSTGEPAIRGLRGLLASDRGGKGRGGRF